MAGRGNIEVEQAIALTKRKDLRVGERKLEKHLTRKEKGGQTLLFTDERLTPAININTMLHSSETREL